MPLNQENLTTVDPQRFLKEIRDGFESIGLGDIELLRLPQDLSADRLLLTLEKKSLPSLNISVALVGGIPIIARLGQGGMGAVYYGFHPRLRTQVAIKILPLDASQRNPDLIERFKREAHAAAKIRSPHLVSVLDINEDRGLFYMVLEYVHGLSAGSLLRTLDSKSIRMSELDALQICYAATKGLAAAHQENVIHRDIKPDNIMIPFVKNSSTADYITSKLADLGLARIESNKDVLTQDQAAMGTPGFMAPEQATDAHDATTASDVFSMGATLYNLLSGRPPFQSTTAMKTILETLNVPHLPIRQLRSDVPEDISKLLDRCLSKTPAQRIKNGTELLHELAHILATRNPSTIIEAPSTIQENIAEKVDETSPNDFIPKRDLPHDWWTPLRDGITSIRRENPHGEAAAL